MEVSGVRHDCWFSGGGKSASTHMSRLRGWPGTWQSYIAQGTGHRGGQGMFEMGQVLMASSVSRCQVGCPKLELDALESCKKLCRPWIFFCYPELCDEAENFRTAWSQRAEWLLCSIVLRMFEVLVLGHQLSLCWTGGWGAPQDVGSACVLDLTREKKVGVWQGIWNTRELKTE